MKDNIYIGTEAIQGVANGINRVSDIVKTTLGAAGKNVIIEKDLFPFHIITNDGISIAEACYFEDPLEQRGADLVKEVNKLTDRGSGDGRTTTTVLMQAIVNEGIKSGVSGMEIKRSLDELVPFIEQEIDNQKKPISEDTVASIATIAGENEEIGQMIQEIYQSIGKSGIIQVDNSGTDETFYKLRDGVKFDGAQLISSALFTDENKAVYENPVILVTKRKIATVGDLDPLLQKLDTANKREVVIFCDDMDNSVASALIATHKVGLFKVAVIKAPTLWKDYIFEDFAKVTGATVISDSTGITFKNMTLEHLGTVGKIITDRYETLVMGIKDISDHIKDLTDRGDNDSLLRLAWLNTKACVIKVGAGSESDLSYKRRKVADAVHASRLALQDGVVAGGGVALANVAKKLPESLGGNVLKKAFYAPVLQIMANAGANGTTYDFTNNPEYSENVGFNAKTGQFVDMWEAGILDPALVVKNAVRNAISVAGTVLTAGGVITKPKKKDMELLGEILKPQRPEF